MRVTRMNDVSLGRNGGVTSPPQSAPAASFQDLRQTLGVMLAQLPSDVQHLVASVVILERRYQETENPRLRDEIKTLVETQVRKRDRRQS